MAAQPPAPQRDGASGSLVPVHSLSATASDTSANSEERPWAHGVPAEQQAAARELFTAANRSLKDSLLRQAAEGYREALKHWEHPAIHYNLALALLSLDQPIEVRQHLLAAAKYGTLALGPLKSKQLETYLQLVGKQLSTLTVAVTTPGIVVTLDGRFLFKSPGRYEEVMLPGPHTLRASRDGYLPQSRPIKLLPGEATVVDRFDLYRPDDLIRYRRRWPVWGPITLTGAGAAVAAVGGLLLWQGQNAITDYDQRVNDLCANGGCLNNSELHSLDQRSKTFRTAGFITLGAGGAALASGLVLIYLNRQTPYNVDPETQKRELLVTPLVGERLIGITSMGRF